MSRRLVSTGEGKGIHGVVEQVTIRRLLGQHLPVTQRLLGKLRDAGRGFIAERRFLGQEGKEMSLRPPPYPPTQP
jgi:hypothetical protein